MQNERGTEVLPLACSSQFGEHTGLVFNHDAVEDAATFHDATTTAREISIHTDFNSRSRISTRIEIRGQYLNCEVAHHVAVRAQVKFPRTILWPPNTLFGPLLSETELSFDNVFGKAREFA